MTLYELTGEWQKLGLMLEDADTEEAWSEILDRMEEVECSIAEKGEAYAKVRLNLTAEAEAIDREIKRLAERKRAKLNAAERLTDNLLAAMVAMDAEKVETSIGAWKRVMNPYSVTVTDIDKIPERFHIKQPDTVDKRAILAEFKSTGEVFDGVEMTRKESVRFR